MEPGPGEVEERNKKHRVPCQVTPYQPVTLNQIKLSEVLYVNKKNSLDPYDVLVSAQERKQRLIQVLL